MNAYDDAVVPHMGQRAMRLWHLQWHGIRETWLGLSESDQNRYKTLMGAVPKPSIGRRGEVLVGNGAGQDFLSMHRGMLGDASARLAGAEPISRWVSPASFSTATAQVGVPRDFSFPTSVYLGKDDDRWNAYLLQAKTFFDTDFLRSVNLDTLGTLIEYGLHAAMHQRFGGFGSNKKLRLSSSSRNAVVRGTSIDSKWDLPAYDSLLDAYAAHVNRAFWDIHGWIDSVVAAWEAVNDQQLVPTPMDMLMMSGDQLSGASENSPAEEPHAASMNMPTMRESRMPDVSGDMSTARLEGAVRIILKAGYSGVFQTRLDHQGCPLLPNTGKLGSSRQNAGSPSEKCGTAAVDGLVLAESVGIEATKQFFKRRVEKAHREEQKASRAGLDEPACVQDMESGKLRDTARGEK